MSPLTKRSPFALLTLALFLCSLCAPAQTPEAPAQTQSQLRLPHMLSDHAVLQRDRPIHIWGWDTPGATITVDFRHQHAFTKADDLGAFSVYLAPESAGGPDTLTIHGTGAGESSTITLSDILVGDVWFASGQSNMEMPLRGFPNSAVIKDSDKEIASAADPTVCGQMRLLLFDRRTNDYPLDDQPSSWTGATPPRPPTSPPSPSSSAARSTPASTSPSASSTPPGAARPSPPGPRSRALASDSTLMPVFAARARFADHQTNLAAQQAYEQRALAAAKAANQPAPKFDWHPNQSSWEPSFLFNGMIAPAVAYTIRGFLWYQGETDSNPALHNPQLYSRLFPTMIRDWRARWNEGDLPFLYVQISNFYSPTEDWGTIRDAQRQTLSVTNTAMAVSIDVGTRDNVHPPDKQTVAARLALGARDLVYGEHVEDTGPLPISVTTSGSDTLRVWFSHADGLHATGNQPHGFELAGPDNQFHPADAAIDGTTVLVHSTAVPHPTRVRYAWASFTDANLFNAAGLPASTFFWP